MKINSKTTKAELLAYVEELECKNSKLSQMATDKSEENYSLAKKIDKQDLTIREQSERIFDLESEVSYYKNRGFFGRMFNI